MSSNSAVRGGGPGGHASGGDDIQDGVVAVMSHALVGHAGTTWASSGTARSCCSVTSGMTDDVTAGVAETSGGTGRLAWARSGVSHCAGED